MKFSFFFFKKIEPYLHLTLLIILINIGIWKNISLHIILMGCICLEIIIGLSRKKSIADLIGHMRSSVGKAFDTLLIFILLGPLIVIWISSGSIPTLIHYGFFFLSPIYFLPFTFLFCSLSSLVIGSSWGTASTIGLVMLLIGESLQIPKEMIVGAIVSGSFFGDKMSPISDTTNLAAATAQTPLESHIKAMSKSSVPAFFLALLAFYILGLPYQENILFKNANQIQEILATIFHLHIFTLLPIFVLIACNFLRFHAITGMFLSIFSGIFIALIFQDTPLNILLNQLMAGYNEKTGIDFVDNLLCRGGLDNLFSTFLLCFIALCLGGLIAKNGLIKSLIAPIIDQIKSIPALAILVLIMGFLSTLLLSEIYLGILITASFFQPIFKERNISASFLSRLVEESTTVLGPLIPWTTASIFLQAVLGVPTKDYLLFCFFNLINVSVSILLIFWKGEKNR